MASTRFKQLATRATPGGADQCPTVVRMGVHSNSAAITGCQHLTAAGAALLMAADFSNQGFVVFVWPCT